MDALAQEAAVLEGLNLAVLCVVALLAVPVANRIYCRNLLYHSLKIAIWRWDLYHSLFNLYRHSKILKLPDLAVEDKYFYPSYLLQY